MRADQAALHLVGLRDRSSKESTNRKFTFAAYNVVIGKVRALGQSQLTIKKINSMDITPNMNSKLRTIIQTTSKVSIKQQLTGILGIGNSRAVALIKAGLTNMKQLHLKKWQLMLPKGARIILKYNPMTHIPRKVVTIASNKMPRSGDAIIVGSYRRGKLTSRDIDIMIVGDQKALVRYVDELVKKFSGIVYLQGSDKTSLLMKIGSSYVKTDVFRASPAERVAMLTYSTGSRLFNIRMRSKAKKMGYLLNQTGLFNRKTGQRISIRSERSLFKTLQMNWVEPEHR